MPTILICDDSRVDRANLARIVSNAGFAVQTADDGRAAIEQVRRAPPALLFLDVNMPEMDGFAALRALRKDPRYVSMPVVMVSSKGQQADFVWARLQGANGYVVKPYTDAQIQDQLAQHVAVTVAEPARSI